MHFENSSIKLFERFRFRGARIPCLPSTCRCPFFLSFGPRVNAPCWSCTRAWIITKRLNFLLFLFRPFTKSRDDSRLNGVKVLIGGNLARTDCTEGLIPKDRVTRIAPSSLEEKWPRFNKRWKQQHHLQFFANIAEKFIRWCEFPYDLSLYLKVEKSLVDVNFHVLSHSPHSLIEKTIQPTREDQRHEVLTLSLYLRPQQPQEVNSCIGFCFTKREPILSEWWLSETLKNLPPPLKKCNYCTPNIVLNTYSLS